MASMSRALNIAALRSLSQLAGSSHIQGTHSRASEAGEFIMGRSIPVHGLILLTSVTVKSMHRCHTKLASKLP